MAGHRKAAFPARDGRRRRTRRTGARARLAGAVARAGHADAFRRPERIAPLALACEADKRRRLGLADDDYPQGRELRRLHAAAMAVTTRDFDVEALTGPAVGDALRKAHIEAIAEARCG